MYSRPLKGKNLIGIAVSIVLSTCIILICSRIWEADLSLPLAFSGDTLLGGTLIKSIVEDGIRGLWFGSRLGTPEISVLVDTPFLDLRMSLEYLILTRLFSNPWVCYNLLYLFSYIICTLVMYLLLNRYTERVWLKIILSIAYAFVPYHFIRGLGHLTLSCYYIVPLAIYVMEIIYNEPFRGIVPQRYHGAWGKTIVLYLSCFIVGISNIYYAYFGLICMAVALIGKLIKTRKIKPVFQEGLLICFVLFSVMIGLLPKIVYSLRNGFNHSAGIRSPLETEVYGLKIIQLLLPCYYNRIGFLAKLNQDYSNHAFNINENSAASLGIIATIGFLIACEWVIYRIVKRDQQKSQLFSNIDIATLAILTLILFSTGGGFGTFVSYWITPEMRCLNRSSVVIAGLSICVLCFALEYVLERTKKGWISKGVAICMTGILTFAIYSEVPISAEGWQGSTKEQNIIYTNFFSEIESKMEPGAMIYELPYMSFPENPPINKMNDYQPALGYMYTDTLRWSYGGMKGRNTIAESLFIDNGKSYSFVGGIRKVGFSGVLIDTTGFSDGGEEIIEFYSRGLHIDPIISGDEQFYFYDIRNLEIDARSLVAGYGFVERFAQLTGVNIDEESTAIYAERIQKTDSETIDLMWDWLSNCSITETQMNNRDYIRFLYSNIIGRDEEHPEGWSSQLDAGSLTRKDAFEIFITCDEFRNRNGFI